jgi:hypothetical protein
MSVSEIRPGERVKNVQVGEDTLSVDLAAGRTIIVPLVWYPRLLRATAEQRAHWEISGAGYGIHWPEIDENLSTEVLLAVVTDQNFCLRNSNGQAIRRWEDWTRPKKSSHWQPGRSAMELARLWFQNGRLTCPKELTCLLQSHDRTRDFRLLDGKPEFVTPLPKRGEGRNHDLWLRAISPGGYLTICIEAKTDEAFGGVVSEEIRKARKRRSTTQLSVRIETLLRFLSQRACNPEEEPWSQIRYQLITAFAGTAIQACRDRSSTAVLVIQNFDDSSLNASLKQKNNDDLQRMIFLLFPNGGMDIQNQLIGPITIACETEKPAKIDLFVGRVQSNFATGELAK